MVDLSEGSEFAGCRIEAVAGRGGMGVVYRATQLALDRRVALKVIAPGLAPDNTFRARFQREARMAASIEHPNVLPVYEAGERDDVLFLTMRYVEGTDLRALLRSEGPLEVQRAAQLLVPVALALNAAHQRGLVHRDVKPANVLIAAPGSEHEHVYLTDFGIARSDATAGEMTVTQTGMFVGTIDYMAPERMTGERGDSRVDIYAFGCMLFEALAGRVPFPREQEVARIHAHVNEPLPPLSEIRSGVPPAVDAVVQKACAKNPDDRFATAAELAKALAAASGGTLAADAGPGAAEAETVPADGVPTVPAPAPTVPAPPPTVPATPPTSSTPPPTVPAPPPAPEADTDVPTAATEPEPARPVPPRPRPVQPAAAPARPPSRRRYVLPALIGVVVLAAVGAVIALSGGGSSPARSTAASTPTTTTTTNGAAQFKTENGPIYSISVPADWSSTVLSRGGHVEGTRWTDPRNPEISVRVDSIRNLGNPALTRAQNTRRGAANSTELGFDQHATVAGRPGVVWQYQVGGTQFVDSLFDTSCHGYAVLGRAPVADFLSVAPTFRRITDSLRPTPC